MTEKKWKSLEYRIREVAYQAMQKKQDEHNAKVRLTTKIMEPEEIKEMAEEDVIELALDEADDYGKGKIFKHMDTGGVDTDTMRQKSWEEVEVVDEVSKEKLQNYVKKAVTDHGLANFTKRQTTDPKEKISFAKIEAKRKKGISTAINKLDKKEEVEIAELAPAPTQDPMKEKMAAQKQQVKKQKDQLRMQLSQQKAAKQEQAMKTKGEKSIEKIKEDEELTERMHQRVRTFGRATKLQKLHAAQYSRLSAAGDLGKAEMHRKRANEYKRISYMAKDNPGKLPVV